MKITQREALMLSLISELSDQLTVNQLVVGSIPTAGAKIPLSTRRLTRLWDPAIPDATRLSPRVGPKVVTFGASRYARRAQNIG